MRRSKVESHGSSEARGPKGEVTAPTARLDARADTGPAVRTSDCASSHAPGRGRARLLPSRRTPDLDPARQEARPTEYVAIGQRASQEDVPGTSHCLRNRVASGHRGEQDIAACDTFQAAVARTQQQGAVLIQGLRAPPQTAVTDHDFDLAAEGGA